MIVTVFRSRIKPGVMENYSPMALQMSQLAKGVPGYISHKGFVADDGERITVVEFESEEAMQAWRVHPEHAMAKRRGITEFFSEYPFHICEVVRTRKWVAKSG